MSKIEIIGSKSVLTDTIELLHSLGIMHIESIPEEIYDRKEYIQKIPLDKGKVALRDRLIGLLDKLKGIMVLLSEPKTPRPSREELPMIDPDSEDTLSVIVTLDKQIHDLHKRKIEIINELSLISKYEKVLKSLAPMITRLKVLRFFETMGISLERDKVAIIPLLEEELERITEGKCQIFVRDIDKETIGVVLTYPRVYDFEVRCLLRDESISELKLPTEYEELPIFEALRKMMTKKEELPRELSTIEETLDSMSGIWFYKIRYWMDVIKDILNEVEAISYCAQTRYSFILAGWVPSDSMPLLYKVFKDNLGDRVMIRELELKEKEMENVPVWIKNPPYIEPFEVFMSILPSPKYGSIDPTPYIAIFFPIFFGLILGDTGYGLIILMASIFFRRRFRDREIIYRFLTVLLIASMFSIIFGILFGEFFGSLGERMGFHPIFFDRIKALKTFLVLSITIGCGHVFLGMILALINNLQRRKKKEALGKFFSIIVVAALFILTGVMAGYLDRRFLTPLVTLIIILFPLLIVLEGAMAPLEIMKTLSNILSYARIMAIGTSSVVLALVANRLGSMTENVFLGIMLASLVHILNIMVGVFDPTIQSIRLHYVEFFGKFYQPGGRRYEPFRKYRMG